MTASNSSMSSRGFLVYLRLRYHLSNLLASPIGSSRFFMKKTILIVVIFTSLNSFAFAWISPCPYFLYKAFKYKKSKIIDAENLFKGFISKNAPSADKITYLKKMQNINDIWSMKRISSPLNKALQNPVGSGLNDPLVLKEFSNLVQHFYFSAKRALWHGYKSESYLENTVGVLQWNTVGLRMMMLYSFKMQPHTVQKLDETLSLLKRGIANNNELDVVTSSTTIVHHLNEHTFSFVVKQPKLIEEITESVLSAAVQEVIKYDNLPMRNFLRLTLNDTRQLLVSESSMEGTLQNIERIQSESTNAGQATTNIQRFNNEIAPVLIEKIDRILDTSEKLKDISLARQMLEMESSVVSHRMKKILRKYLKHLESDKDYLVEDAQYVVRLLYESLGSEACIISHL